MTRREHQQAIPVHASTQVGCFPPKERGMAGGVWGMIETVNKLLLGEHPRVRWQGGGEDPLVMGRQRQRGPERWGRWTEARFLTKEAFTTALQRSPTRTQRVCDLRSHRL